MAELVDRRRVHMIGAGGIGMSGLAKILAQAGHRVSGSDLKPSHALSALEGAGVEIWIGHRPEAGPSWGLVVASSAVPARDVEIVAARAAGVEVWERPRLLSEITSRLPTIGVTGTHGKTSGTAMLLAALRAPGARAPLPVGGGVGGRGVGGWFVWRTRVPADWLKPCPASSATGPPPTPCGGSGASPTAT